MDRNSLLRVALIAGVLLLGWFLWGKFSGKNDKPQAANLPEVAFVDAPGFPKDPIDPPFGEARPKPTEDDTCAIKGERFHAVFSARGAGMTHLFLEDAKYAAGAVGMDLVSTPDIERWRNLRSSFRGKDANDQVKYDRFMWKSEKRDDRTCAFTYQDDDVKIVKTFTAAPRPFEIEVDTQVTNLSSAPKKHQLTMGLFAYRQNHELKGSLGRVSPWQTDLECGSGKDVTRKNKDDFKSGWFYGPTTDRYAAVNSHYFAQALALPGGLPPVEQPHCDLLAEQWVSAGQAADADDAGNVFHATLTWPTRELAPQAVAEYKQSAFFGPKERDILAHAGGGSAKLGDVINLGFFTPVAKVLVTVLRFIHDKITFGNWGVAIIVMTIALRTLLFPLTLKSIKSSVAMRRLKPEVDKLNEKFKDDAQAKNLAMMELWKKNGVNPLGGCLPQMVQMPVWFAMYTTLQTAVEMYHVKFLWFADLSSPDKFYILPLLLGVFMILQQRIVPQQGMDPTQAKMMMWLMPGVFTVMMLFLPAALGVYMLTNSILGITQQLVVEQVAPRNPGGGATTKSSKEIVVKEKARV